MPGHSFEDRQRKAGYSSFVRAPVDRTPAPTRGTISFGSSDPAKKSNREFNEELERQQREQEQARGTPLTGQGSTVNTQEQIQNLRNIGVIDEPKKTGIFGIDFSNVGLPAVGPFFGAIQGLGSTETFFKNLATKGAGGLSLKDKVTLVNLIDRLGTSPESIENLLQTYADKNEVSADVLASNFNRAYSDIQSNVAQSGVSEYFNRIGEIGEYDDSLKTMAGDLTGTRDTEGIITLENVTDNLGTEGLQFLKVTNPQAYYRLRPNDPDLANESFVSTGDKVADRRFNAKIMEARAEAMNRQSRQDANMGQGIMAASPAFASPASQYGIFIGKPGPFIGNFIDQDGDGVDDRFQTGPGQPRQPFVNPKAPLPGASGTAQPVGTGITPFNVNQFYASLPQFQQSYSQQGVSPSLLQFLETAQRFPTV